MLQFEIKKVFSKFKNKMALILLFIILIVTSILTMNRVEYVDADGERSSGISAAKSLSTEQNKWAGYLTEDVFADVIKENEQINNSPEEAKQVYEKRVSSLKAYLDSGEETFTDAQKNFLIYRYESLDFR